MSESTQLLLYGLATLLVFFTLVWAVTLRTEKTSVVDVFWGVGFVVLALVYSVLGGGLTRGKAQVVFASVLLWALRLSGYLAWRSWGQPEDYRYAAMRQYWGESFRWLSLFTVFWLQAFLIWLVAMPLYVVFTTNPQGWATSDTLAFFLFAFGFTFETVADWQLASFKRRSGGAKRVLQSGLWRYSRHPNYFGEAVVWWALFLFAVSQGGWWTIFSPVLMTFLLLRVSGVALLERGMTKRHPEYGDYAARTSAFLPWWPKNSKR